MNKPKTLDNKVAVSPSRSLTCSACRGYKVRISELSEMQKQHLAWRLDHKTYVGYITACRIARGEFGDDTLLEVFTKAGKSEHAAKIHARKVLNFQKRSI